MDLKEALEWLQGTPSMTNIIPQDPYETWQVRIAQADAAMTQQAYWIVKAHEEKLLSRIDKDVLRKIEKWRDSAEAQVEFVSPKAAALMDEQVYAYDRVITLLKSSIPGKGGAKSCI